MPCKYRDNIKLWIRHTNRYQHSQTENRENKKKGYNHSNQEKRGITKIKTNSKKKIKNIAPQENTILENNQSKSN